VITVLENGAALGADKLCTESIIHLHTHILEIFHLELSSHLSLLSAGPCQKSAANLLGEV